MLNQALKKTEAPPSFALCSILRQAEKMRYFSPNVEYAVTLALQKR
jgi:hypothetical protein